MGELGCNLYSPHLVVRRVLLALVHQLDVTRVGDFARHPGVAKRVAFEKAKAGNQFFHFIGFIKKGCKPGAFELYVVNCIQLVTAPPSPRWSSLPRYPCSQPSPPAPEKGERWKGKREWIRRGEPFFFKGGRGAMRLDRDEQGVWKAHARLRPTPRRSERLVGDRERASGRRERGRDVCALHRHNPPLSRFPRPPLPSS
jgi:hypothetical protein